jgi:hypothetical protein
MRGRVLLALTLVLTGVFCLGLALGQITWLQLPGWLGGSSGYGDALAPSRPISIEIPSLSVRARVRPVGLDDSGAIAAPPMRRAHETGWYEDGPSPGQHGAAVIVGHVDDEDGPAVFHGLLGLQPGDRIEVSRRDRVSATFEVTQVRTYPKTALPADEVYGDFSRPELRLITCGGRWIGGQDGYADNVVVFATLIAPP